MWIEDFDDEFAYVEKSIWTADNHERKYGRFSYTFDESALTATITSEFEEMVLTWLTLEENQKLQDERNTVSAEFEKLKVEFNEYKNKYSTPNEEVETLKQFQSDKLAEERKESEDALFAQFEQLSGVEEFEELKKKASEFSIEQLEKEVAFIMVKNNAIFKFSVKPATKNKVKIEFTKTEVQIDERDELFNKYLKKE